MKVRVDLERLRVFSSLLMRIDVGIVRTATERNKAN